MMKKILVGMMLVLGLGGCGGIQNDDVLKIGVSIPLSGDAASYGVAFKNGMEMALDKLEPELRERIEMTWEDDQFLPIQTVTNFNKLMSVDGIDAFVTIGSTTGNAVASLVEQKAEVSMIGWISDPKVVEGRNWVMNFGVTPEMEVEKLVEEVRKRGYKKIAEVATVQDACLLWKKLFNEGMGDEIEIVMEEEFPVGIKDFRSFVTKLKQKEVDAVFVDLFPGQLGLFVKQLHGAGIEIPFFNVETFEDSNEVEISGGILVGHWYVAGDVASDEFFEEYERRFPGESVFGAPEGHDIMLLLAEGVKKYGKDPAKINEWLHNVENFEGVLGTFSASGRNDFTLPVAVKIVTEDGFEKLYK